MVAGTSFRMVSWRGCEYKERKWSTFSNQRPSALRPLTRVGVGVDPATATVADVMISEVHTVSPESPIGQAAMVMARQKIRHLVVTDPHGRVVGVLSERDVLKNLAPWLSKLKPGIGQSETALRKPVGQFMIGEPTTIAVTAPLHEAVHVLASRKIGCLPVTDQERKLRGLITRADLLRCMERTLWPAGPAGA